MPFTLPTSLLPVREQSAQASSATTTTTATFAATPKGNSILIAVAHANVAVASISINTAGWGAAVVSNDFTSAPVRGVALFAKQAGAGEGTTVQMTGTGASLCRLHIIEYSNVRTPAALNNTQTDTTAGTTNGLTTGGSGPLVAVYAVATNGNNGGWVSWTAGVNSVQSVGAMESGEYIGNDLFGTVTGTWTTTRDAGGVAAVFPGVFNNRVGTMLQAVNRASTY